MDLDAQALIHEINEARQEKARSYHRLKLRLSLLSMGIGVIVLLLFLTTGINILLRNLLAGASLLAWQPFAGYFPLQILVYFLIAMVIYELLTLPVAYYSGFVLPWRYGLSVLSLRGWLKDTAVSFVLSLVLESIFISLVYALLAFQPQLWWLEAGLIILFFSVVMANLAPVLLFPLFYKFTPLPEGELKQRLLALAAGAKTKIRGVFVMKMSNKTTMANAALMGLGNTRRVVLGDTMVDRYTPDEIEVVLAHELGHHVHVDIWKLILSQSLLILSGLYLASLLLHWAINIQHLYHSLTDPASLPFFFLLVGIFSIVVMPLGNGFSRSIEYQADEYALQSTRKISAFKSAMTRLANQNLAEIAPSPLVEFILYSHPSIRKRLAHADDFARRNRLHEMDGRDQASSAALNAES